MNRAYDLACCRTGWRRHFGGGRDGRPNKAMKLTKGGWCKSEALWSAAIAFGRHP